MPSFTGVNRRRPRRRNPYEHFPCYNATERIEAAAGKNADGIRPVTQAEYAALQNHAWATQKTQSDWGRDTLLRQLETGGSPQQIEHYVFIELVGVQLLLMNTLGPLLRGERLTPEQLDSVLRQVQAAKARKAQEILNKRVHEAEQKA